MLLLPLLLVACDMLPRDTDGTLARIRAARTVRIGVVTDAGAQGAAAALGARITRATGARALFVGGAGEALLLGLDEDKVDLVVGAFGEQTPWRDKVSLTPPVVTAGVGRTRLEVRAAVRNGENRWAMLVEHAARETAGPEAGQ